MQAEFNHEEEEGVEEEKEGLQLLVYSSVTSHESWTTDGRVQMFLLAILAH